MCLVLRFCSRMFFFDYSTEIRRNLFVGSLTWWMKKIPLGRGRGRKTTRYILYLLRGVSNYTGLIIIEMMRGELSDGRNSSSWLSPFMSNGLEGSKWSKNNEKYWCDDLMWRVVIVALSGFQFTSSHTCLATHKAAYTRFSIRLRRLGLHSILAPYNNTSMYVDLFCVL